MIIENRTCHNSNHFVVKANWTNSMCVDFYLCFSAIMGCTKEEKKYFYRNNETTTIYVVVEGNNAHKQSFKMREKF